MSRSRSERFLASQPDSCLVTLARAGNERAFAAIVERYRPELLSHARRLTADGRAEDVVQQAFLSAFAALQSGADVRHLRGWLYRIVRNETISSHRPLDASLESVAETGETLEDVVAQRALAFRALSELGRLPGRQREALVGTALQGRGRSEIASAMGLSEGAVRQLVHRARMALRSAVTALIPYPLARWVGAIRTGAEPSADVSVSAGVASAGVASAGGVALKFGALVASGVVATGVVVDEGGARHAHRTPARSSAAVHRASAGLGSSLFASASPGPSLRRVEARVAPGPVTGDRVSGTRAEDHRSDGSGGRDSSASSGRGRGPSAEPQSGGGSDSRGGPSPGGESSGGGPSGSSGGSSGSSGGSSGSGGGSSGSSGGSSGSGGGDDATVASASSEHSGSGNGSDGGPASSGSGGGPGPSGSSGSGGGPGPSGSSGSSGSTGSGSGSDATDGSGSGHGRSGR